MIELCICRALIVARVFLIVGMCVYGAGFFLALYLGMIEKTLQPIKYFCYFFVIWCCIPSIKEHKRMFRYYYKKSIRQRRGLE